MVNIQRVNAEQKSQYFQNMIIKAFENKAKRADLSWNSCGHLDQLEYSVHNGGDGFGYYALKNNLSRKVEVSIEISKAMNVAIGNIFN